MLLCLILEARRGYQQNTRHKWSMGSLVIPASRNRFDYTCTLVKEIYLCLYKLLQATMRTRNIVLAKFGDRKLAKGTYLGNFVRVKGDILHEH